VLLKEAAQRLICAQLHVARKEKQAITNGSIPEGHFPTAPIRKIDRYQLLSKPLASHEKTGENRPSCFVELKIQVFPHPHPHHPWFAVGL
jgi:hypothetical protein